jgi:hypothetical protein
LKLGAAIAYRIEDIESYEAPRLHAGIAQADTQRLPSDATQHSAGSATKLAISPRSTR